MSLKWTNGLPLYNRGFSLAYRCLGVKTRSAAYPKGGPLQPRRPRHKDVSQDKDKKDGPILGKARTRTLLSPVVEAHSRQPREGTKSDVEASFRSKAGAGAGPARDRGRPSLVLDTPSLPALLLFLYKQPPLTLKPPTFFFSPLSLPCRDLHSRQPAERPSSSATAPATAPPTSSGHGQRRGLAAALARASTSSLAQDQQREERRSGVAGGVSCA